MKRTAAQRAEDERRDRDARIEDVEFLLQHEGNASDIIRRSGYPTLGAAQIALRRAGRHDLSRKLGSLGATGDPYNDHSGYFREKMFA